MKNLKKMFGLLVVLASMLSCAAVDEAKASDPWQNLAVGDIMSYGRSISNDTTSFYYSNVFLPHYLGGDQLPSFDDSLLGKMIIDTKIGNPNGSGTSLHSFIHAGYIAGASWQFDNDTTATYKEDGIINNVFNQTFNNADALAAGVDITAGGHTALITITYYPEGYERNLDHSYTYYFEGTGDKAVLTRISTETITGA